MLKQELPGPNGVRTSPVGSGIDHRPWGTAQSRTTSSAGEGTVRGRTGATTFISFSAAPMRLSGRDTWGPPENRENSIRVARRAVDLGVDFIDTADVYGFDVTEEILAEALYPYPEQLLVSTKIGQVQTRPREWAPVVRNWDPVVDHCAREGIAFVPWYPILAGGPVAGKGVLSDIAKSLEATPAQVSLAWLPARSPMIAPIPGTASIEHLEENMAATQLELSPEQFATLLETPVAADVPD